MLVLHGGGDIPDGIALIAKALGIDLLEAEGLGNAQRICQATRPEIILVPAMIAGQSSLPFIQTCLERAQRCQAVMLVERDQINEAAEAMRVGILECLFLPFSNERLAKTLAAALGRLGMAVPEAELEQIYKLASPAPRRPAPVQAPQPLHQTANSDCVQGDSPATLELKSEIHLATQTRLPVVLLGEAGAGKSHCAGLIHAESSDANAPFHKLDCAALTLETLPAEMGDVTTRATFFLDELTDLNPKVQARLVRLIGDEGLPQARLISATTHDPIRAINGGILRRDLYYRLCVTQIHVPPLRARGRDILLIAQGKLRQFALLEGSELRGFSPDCAELLVAYSWPGNIRQLMNVCRNLVLTQSGSSARLVTPEMLPPEITRGGASDTPMAPGANGETILTEFFRGKSLAEIERRVIEAVIRDHGGSVTRAARVLEVAPSTLYRKREQWAREDSPGE